MFFLVCIHHELFATTFARWMVFFSNTGIPKLWRSRCVAVFWIQHGHICWHKEAICILAATLCNWKSLEIPEVMNFLGWKVAKQKIFLLSADKVVKRRSDSFNQRPRGRNRAALRGSDWPSQDFKCQAADFVAMACHFWHESRWLQFALWHVRGF